MNYSYGDFDLRWSEGAHVSMGNFCSLANNIKIYLDGNHCVDCITTYPFGHLHRDVFPFHGKQHSAPGKDVTIGNDVWIAENVIIMPGVTIGDGAVIANSSHVVKDVPPYAMVGGNPAQVIRYRFADDQIEALLRIKWWDWNESKINRHLHLLCSPDIAGFIKAAKEDNG